MNKFGNFLKLIISLAMPLIAGALGSIATASSVETWYKTLEKPFFSPSNYLFAPVWTLLYILMGISFYLIWRNGFKKKPFFAYFVQLTLNLLWSFLFFGFKSPLAGFICIVFLWFTIIWNIVEFYKVKKISGILLVPYLLWVSFASVLNFYIFILN